MIRAIDKWFVPYLRSVMRRPECKVRPRHLIFCVADHFEPVGNTSSREEARRLTGAWAARYRTLLDDLNGLNGFNDFNDQPRHTFFYPAEEYDEGCVASLAGLAASGLAEVEVQLHHRNDTEESLHVKIVEIVKRLRENHGLLGNWHARMTDDRGRTTDDGERRTANGERATEAERPAFGFVHGNWSLCNSRPDGDWCGVNNELSVLAKAGCYADFTFPSAPSPTQPRMVNAIYRATDTGVPRAHDKGTPVSTSSSGLPLRCCTLRSPSPFGRFRFHPSSLMIIQGPLALDWRRRKWGILPRLENGALTPVNPPTPGRVDLWARQAICVQGRPEWVFVKVHMHGAAPWEAPCRSQESRLRQGYGGQAGVRSQDFVRMHRYLAERYNDGEAWRLHYVTAREMYNMVRAAEDGCAGDPGDFRDYEVGRPALM